MRETTSNHTECIRTPASRVWPTTRRFFRPNLNVPLLAKLLSVAGPDITKSTSGKRRAGNPPLTARRSKRTRTSHGSDDDFGEVDEDSDDSDSVMIRDGYPPVRPGLNHTSSGDIFPVLHHVIEIQYVESTEHRSTAEPVEQLKAWEREDCSLKEVLDELSRSTSSSEPIDLGEVQLGDYDGRVIAISSDKRYNLGTNEWLFLVPSLVIDGPSNDYTESPANDLLTAIRILQDTGEINVAVALKAIVHPTNGPNGESPSLPFSLQLDVTVSLTFPMFLEYVIPKRSTKKAIAAHEDAQRRLLGVAYGGDEADSNAVNEPVTVSAFYSILGPAPRVSTKEALHAMQPDALLPNLLPFQCRSVAWLLEKEGMSALPDGSIVPKAASAGFSFWREVQVGGRSLYFNRLSGDLIEDKPEIAPVFGGMLAEEPGLGKTLETIGLILLNPAPPEWNPSLTRWDDVARFDVKAVKTSLIVTPPSLVSQWRDELANHAPSLKVLIYDGWTKVAVPIMKNDRELQRLSRLKLNDKAKKKKAKKKKKRAGKARADDSNSSEDDMDVDDDDYSSDSRKSDDQLEWCDYVHQFDVVITTYSVLRSEIWVARPGPDRPKREEASYSSNVRARSPLVMVEWKRVVMDEVQMVGGGQAAEMVSLIPRLSSLAVSGTPAKAQMSDLIHVLKFLRIDQLVGNLRFWNRLLNPGFATEFTDFLQHFGIRTAKASVTNELTIPEQTRYLVSIELGKVERHVYDQTLEAILQELGLDARGVAASTGWRVDGNLLRSSLRRLRGICTHPQVGQLQRRGDGLYKPGALKTMEAVLQAMRDQNRRNMIEDWKTKIQITIRSAQLLQHDEDDKNRHQHARDTLLAAEEDTKKHIQEIKEQLADHDRKGDALKEEAARLREKQRQVGGDAPAPIDLGKGKGKAREFVDDRESRDGDEEDEEDIGLPKTPAGDEHRTKRRALKQRLREGLLVMHKVKFLQGDVHHVLGNSAEEDASYQQADGLRRGLLKGTEEEATKALDILSTSATKKKLTEKELSVDVPLLGQGGIKSTELMDEVNTLLENVFNEQTKLLWTWRSHILGILTKPLTQNGDAADGQEYQRALDDQGEAETYLQAYAAILADRRQALVSERTLLAAHDVREKKYRQTKAALKAMAEDNDEVLELLQERDDLEFQAEHEVLHSELSTLRKDILLRLNGRAIKSILVELSAIGSRIMPDTHPEKVIVKQAIETIRAFMADQSLLHDKLESDLALLRKAFNQRILYFRQLQEISDSVAEVGWEEEGTVTLALQACQAEKAQLEGKINMTRARHRYLENLAQNKPTDDDDDDDDRTCILCRCDFVRGFITHCAHVFCELCMKAWISRPGSKTCPVCRVPIDPETIQRFTLNAAEKDPPLKPVSGEAAPQSRREIIYNRIGTSLLDDIENIETYGDFGTKIQALVRHLLYLKLTDAGAKSIIFSAWADSLHIVEVALRANGIKSLRIDQKSKGEHATQKFRKDPEILVLLLHGERENAGLNITCASRVFLLESVVHHSFEIQAIARIDRLGQTRPTEVYCYYAEDTIERNILDLAARKGLSLYTKSNSVGTVSVSAFAKEGEEVVDDPDKGKAHQKGDFIYKVDDMLAILFPHMFEELEYLLPPSTEVSSGAGDVSMQYVSSRPPQGGVEVNAVAGPSNLHR